MFEGMENLFPRKLCPDIRMAEIFTDKNMRKIFKFYKFLHFPKKFPISHSIVSAYENLLQTSTVRI
jgi:hypothetical protein